MCTLKEHVACCDWMWPSMYVCCPYCCSDLLQLYHLTIVICRRKLPVFIFQFPEAHRPGSCSSRVTGWGGDVMCSKEAPEGRWVQGMRFTAKRVVGSMPLSLCYKTGINLILTLQHLEGRHRTRQSWPSVDTAPWAHSHWYPEVFHGHLVICIALTHVHVFFSVVLERQTGSSRLSAWSLAQYHAHHNLSSMNNWGKLK